MITTHGGPGVPQPDGFCTALAVNLTDEESRSLAAILRGSKWRVKNARTCSEALDLSYKRPVPVVLCEPQMPDGNWDSLMERMREAGDRTAVVVVSRLADERLWTEVLSLGGYDVLMTPFDRSEVLRVLFLAWMASKREPAHARSSVRKPPAEQAAAGTVCRYAASGS